MYAVIMAGGGGTRLWPLSRAARPKPFLPLLGQTTLLQATVARLAPLIEGRDIFVVTDGRYVALAREQLPGVPATNILAEPTGRNTAAAVALAALSVRRPGDEIMVVLPADHRIVDEAGFRAALAAAAERATNGDLVTLGIRPTGPETGYGYVVATGQPVVVAGLPSWRVARFEEKPSVERATELLAEGRASWNAGIFVWRRDALTAGLERHAADLVDGIGAALAAGTDALARVYPALRSTSIDYALLEPASLEGRVAVVPAEVGWSDLGNWAALLDALAPDAAPGPGPGGGSARGRAGEAGVVGHLVGGSEVMSSGSRDVMVHASGGRLVVVVGLESAIVVDTPDALLVCAKDAAQDVKGIVDRLVAEGRRDRL